MDSSHFPDIDKDSYFSFYSAATKYNILHCNYGIPDALGGPSRSLIRCLLQNSVSERLGGVQADPDLIKRHEFFKEFDWSSAENCSTVPPFIPNIKGPGEICFLNGAMKICQITIGRIDFLPKIWYVK